MREKTILHFRSSDLDLLPLDLKFVPPRHSFQRYATTILEVSKAFLFRENSRHMTDRGMGVLGCWCNTQCGPLDMAV